MRQMSAFEYWLRTGLRLPEPVEHKFNPWHDSQDGRFTFEGQGGYFAGGRTAGERLWRIAGARLMQSRSAVPKPTRPSSTQSIEKITLATPKREPWPGQDSIKPEMNFSRIIKRYQQERIVSPIHVQRFKAHVIPQEGNRNDVYLDSEKIPTVGIGHRVTAADKLKVGDVISDAQKEKFWKQDSRKALIAAEDQMREAGITDPNFFLPLASVNFQLGTEWNREHKKNLGLDYEA